MVEKKNTMTVFHGSSINADNIKIVITDGENKLFKETYHYGYNVSWKKEFATKDKPLDNDLIEAKAKEFSVELEDVKLGGWND